MYDMFAPTYGSGGKTDIHYSEGVDLLLSHDNGEKVDFLGCELIYVDSCCCKLLVM